MHTRICEVVKHSGMSKTDFAKAIGLSQPYLSQLCAGQKTPSDRTISDICREFGCDEVWLRTGEGQPFRQETRQEQIMRFAVRTVKGSDEFRKALVAMLADLTDDEWDGLRQVAEKFIAAYKKE